MKTIAVSVLITALLAPDAIAGSFRIRARENFETGKINFGDGRGNLSHRGFVSVFDLWYEEPFEHMVGLTVHRGRLNHVGSDENSAETVLGLEGKYFPMGKEKPGFFRGGLLAAAVDPAGPASAAWNYGFSVSAGWEYPVWKLGLAPEVGTKLLWGSRGRRWQALTIALGVHFYVFSDSTE